jgi:hypothetical protein
LKTFPLFRLKTLSKIQNIFFYSYFEDSINHHKYATNETKSNRRLLNPIQCHNHFCRLFCTVGFIWDEGQSKAIMFPLWRQNVICGFLYLFAAFGLFHAKKYSYTLMAIASILLILTFIALIILFFSGGIYEVKTFNVMTIRIIITVGFTV